MLWQKRPNGQSWIKAISKFWPTRFGTLFFIGLNEGDCRGQYCLHFPAMTYSRLPARGTFRHTRQAAGSLKDGSVRCDSRKALPHVSAFVLSHPSIAPFSSPTSPGPVENPRYIMTFWDSKGNRVKAPKTRSSFSKRLDPLPYRRKVARTVNHPGVACAFLPKRHPRSPQLGHKRAIFYAAGRQAMPGVNIRECLDNPKKEVSAPNCSIISLLPPVWRAQAKGRPNGLLVISVSDKYVRQLVPKI
ncbi:hypothetical protein DXG01_006924 [Tephrocybe rancida]|nr:hypothetical protein DXG01_006924 [Tephrocybe rancida]